MIIRQLFDSESSTYTYIVACESSRDLRLLRELGLNLKYILETHLHADHVTGASLLRDATGAKVGGKSFAEFAALMAGMKLAQPKNIHIALPAKMLCGKESPAS